MNTNKHEVRYMAKITKQLDFTWIPAKTGVDKLVLCSTNFLVIC